MASSPGSALQAHVLALNRLYVAVQIITARRALCLLWKGLAEVVSVENGAYMTYDFQSWREISELKAALNERGQDEDWVQAVDFEIEVPRTIRLLDYDRVPRNVVKFNRRNIFLRDGNRCQYCGKRFASQDLSLDHVIPRSRGGQSTWENIVCACLRCNVRKGGRTPPEAGMKLIRPPKKPSRSPLLTVKLNLRKYASWKNFLDEVYWTTELQE
ncbi:MAG TPA: HNH endonuclease [Planctomycetaceae bacterium]|nr:HNH endonuclease [Planctomycetaceae bacterium]